MHTNEGRRTAKDQKDAEAFGGVGPAIPRAKSKKMLNHMPIRKVQVKIGRPGYKVTKFISITGANKSTATKVLKEAAWNVELAVDSYFDNNSNNIPTTTANHSAYDRFFDTYKGSLYLINIPDPQSDLIEVDGTEQLLNDLDLDPASVVTLVLAWHMKCQNMCEFTRDGNFYHDSFKGWRDGCKELDVDSVASLKAKIPFMEEELKDDAKAKLIYLFTFQFARLENQRALGNESLLFWDFITTSSPDFADHDTDGISEDIKYLGAWPVLIDSFVEYYNENKDSMAH
ncbi:hypothetical protein HDV02_003205 [Globomyces sp. JEL0801]|nr:hypothetical protein HDV02_003205 [Globomyces sp. JEL0801]